MKLPLAVSLLLLSLAACGAEPPSSQTDASTPGPDAPQVFAGTPNAAPCPSADLLRGSTWPDTACDRGASRSPRFVTVETCGMEAGVYRAVATRRTIATTHGDFFACDGLLLVTPADVAEMYRRAL
jgi:hypothetical protein